MPILGAEPSNAEKGVRGAALKGGFHGAESTGAATCGGGAGEAGWGVAGGRAAAAESQAGFWGARRLDVLRLTGTGVW